MLINETNKKLRNRHKRKISKQLQGMKVQTLTCQLFNYDLALWWDQISCFSREGPEFQASERYYAPPPSEKKCKKSIVRDFSDSQKSTSNDIKSRIDQSLAENTELMNQSLQTLDKGMQEQLQRSLDKMGNNLVSITDRFVDTYEQSASKIIDLTSKISRNQ